MLASYVSTIEPFEHCFSLLCVAWERGYMDSVNSCQCWESMDGSKNHRWKDKDIVIVKKLMEQWFMNK